MKAVAAIVLAALAFASTAQGQGGRSYFDVVDLDHDGRISLSEYIERFSYAFRRMDGNRDGVVDASEQLVKGSPRMTIEQLRAQLTEQYRRQDKNQDGSLSPREFLAPPG